jgi:hypothetical protein
VSDASPTHDGLDALLREAMALREILPRTESDAFEMLAVTRLGRYAVSDSRTRDWYYWRLGCGETRSVCCSERAAARVCTALAQRTGAEVCESEAAWDPARRVYVDTAAVSEVEIRALLDAVDRDQHADAQFANVLRMRCDLGNVDGAGWLLGPLAWPPADCH